MIVDVRKKILIVGLGLLGGSYAKILKRFGFHVSAITKEQSSIDYALREGIIDEGSTELDERIIGEDGKIDLNKFSPITYDPVHHTYRTLGDVVGKAFSDGRKLK